MSNKNTILVRGARVIDPAHSRDEVADVFVKDGKFVAQLSAEEIKSAQVIDAKGLILSPGFVDLNCRLGEPGRSARETFRTGTLAAASGGFTTVVTMPDTNPISDNVGTIQLIRELCDAHAVVNVLPASTLTKQQEGKALAPMGSLKKAGIIAVTDTTSGVQNNEIMRRALEYANTFNLVVLDHCQDSSMTEGAQIHEGTWSLRLGLRGWPRAAEEIVVSSDCVLASLTKARIHLQHISSAGSAEIIRRAKANKLPVTAEVSVLHLLLTDAALAQYDTRLKVNPPLREESDRAALIAALIDGTIDAICSDHSPCTSTEKDCEFDLAPFGAATLETAFSAAYDALVATGHLDIKLLITRLTSGPAKVLGIDAGTLTVGAAADFVLINPKTSWTFNKEVQLSKSGNNPLIGKTFTSRIHSTFVGGKAVISDSKPVQL